MINNTNEIISFDDTETAFSYKNNSELAKAHLLFRLMNNNALVRIATQLTPWAIRSGLPVKGLVRKTIFSQFCGGESLEQTNAVIDILSKHGVGVILDYGVEGKEEEAEFEKATQAFINSMIFAGKHSNIPFV
ncbi:MAG: proline dehydrogenase, partial [Bacteroidota bacterium]